MYKKRIRKEALDKKHRRVRRKVAGDIDRPRLSVFRSGRHIYAQLVDDHNGNTLVATSTLDSELRDKVKGANIEAARLVGGAIARKAIARGIRRVVFDRGGYLYHGRVAALADQAREEGLEF